MFYLSSSLSTGFIRGIVTRRMEMGKHNGVGGLASGRGGVV